MAADEGRVMEGNAEAARPAQVAAAEARALAARARSLPDHVPAAVEVLTIAAGILASHLELDEASACVDEARARDEHVAETLGQQAVSNETRASLAAVHADVALRLGSWGEATDVLDEAIPDARGGPGVPGHGTLLALRAWVAAVGGELAEAEGMLERADRAARAARNDASERADRVDQAKLGDEADTANRTDRPDAADTANQTDRPNAAGTAQRSPSPRYLAGIRAIAAAEIARQRRDARGAIAVLEAELEREQRPHHDLLARAALVDALAGARHPRATEALATFRSRLDEASAVTTYEFDWLDAVVAEARGEYERARAGFEAGAATATSPWVRGRCLLGFAIACGRERGPATGRAPDASRAFDRARFAFASVGAEAYVELVAVHEAAARGAAEG